MHLSPAAAPTPTATDVRRRRAAAVLLVVATFLQLLGQVLLRLPTVEEHGSALWVVSHEVLVLAVVGLVAALVLVASVIGPGALTWVALVMIVVGHGLTLAVLAVDLDVASASVDVIRTLDTWDFLAVAGTVVLVLELRRRRGAQPGAGLALLALAVPPVDGLVFASAVAVLAGFAVLGHSLATDRGHGAPAWLALVTVATYAVAGTLSWPRAALAVVVLAWTVHHMRTTEPSVL